MDDITLRKLAEEQVELYTRSAKFRLMAHDKWILADMFVRFGHKILAKGVTQISTGLSDSTGEPIFVNDVVQYDSDGKLWTGTVEEKFGRYFVYCGGTQHTRLDMITHKCVVMASETKI